MIILTLIGACALFVMLWLIAGGKEKEDDKLVFNIPREIIANHRPAMSLVERSRRRRRLIGEVFSLGYRAREEYERKQQQDQELQDTPYFIRDKSKIIYDK